MLLYLNCQSKTTFLDTKMCFSYLSILNGLWCKPLVHVCNPETDAPFDDTCFPLSQRKTAVPKLSSNLHIQVCMRIDTNLNTAFYLIGDIVNVLGKSCEAIAHITVMP